MCSTIYGPCFSGGERSELSASYEPFNVERNCWSYANEPGYNIPRDGAGMNMLTNKKEVEFTITELEVWEIKYFE